MVIIEYHDLDLFYKPFVKGCSSRVNGLPIPKVSMIEEKAIKYLFDIETHWNGATGWSTGDVSKTRMSS